MYEGNLFYVQSFIDRHENAVDLDKFRAIAGQDFRLPEATTFAPGEDFLGSEAPTVLIRGKVETQQAAVTARRS